MHTVLVKASGTYEVRIGAGLLARAGEWALPLFSGRRAVIVSDANVMALYGDALEESLEKAGFSAERFAFPAGEESKNPETLLSIIQFLADQGLTRTDGVFALGGGVTGDMGGLAAALYLRGIPCVQIPTSLLAMVDSSVGGKTAVDLPQGKNLLGTFTQPRLVLCDTDCLQTLPEEVFAEGMAEVIKYGMIRSEALLGTLEERDVRLPEEAETLEEVITRCVELKRDVVAADELDFGDRQLLNFGHTLGHAAERLSGYGMFHGEGVAMGMGIITRACVKQGKCPAECAGVLERLLNKYGLPRTVPSSMQPEKLLEAARADKKRRGDSITLIQPSALGRCVLYKTDFAELLRVLELGI